MSTISENLTYGPDQMIATDESIDAQAKIRENTARSHNLEGADADHDTIRAAFFEPSGVKAGLVTRGDENDADFWREERARLERSTMSPEMLALYRDSAANSLSSRDAEELDGYRQIDRIENALTALAETTWDGYDDEEPDMALVSRWMQLRPEDRVLMVDNAHVTREDAELLDQAANTAATNVKVAAHSLRVAVQAQEADWQRQQAFGNFVAANGWDDVFATRILRETVAGLNGGRPSEDPMGFIATLSPEQWIEAVRGTAEVMRANGVALESRDFKQALLESDDTSIASGLTQSVPGHGHLPINPVPQLVARPDYSGVDRVIAGRPAFETATEIKAGVLGKSEMDLDYERVQLRAEQLLGERI